MSLTSDLTTGIAALVPTDTAPVYAGFGPFERARNYYQVIPTGGPGVPQAVAGELRDSNFQLNRCADGGSQADAVTYMEALYALLNQRTGWTVGDYVVELCECLQEPFLRAATQPGQVFITFNIRVWARKP